MEPVSLGFAVFATVDLCLQYGKHLVAMYEDYRHAEEEMKGLLLSIEGAWLKTELQLETVCKIWGTMDARLQNHLANVLSHLEAKLQFALAKLEKVTKSKKGHLSTAVASLNLNLGPINKFRYVFGKESMIKMIKDLKDWQEEFSPSWYLITLIANPVIDASLEETKRIESSPTGQLQKIRNTRRRPSFSAAGTEKASIFLNSKLLGEDKELVSPPSGTFVSWYGNNERRVIIYTVSYPPDTDIELATKHVRDLARVLSSNDPLTSGLLTCYGVIKTECEPSSKKSFDFVFEIPQSLLSPTFLRSVLLSEASYPLNERLHLAKVLARSVMFVHTSGFVHKNIRPETVLVFQSEKFSLGEPFLIGFERFRPAASGTTRQGDSLWEKNLYRHPRRQGLYPEDFYKMQHDIYSLGVCLLEIGLWTSFVSVNESGNKPGAVLDIAEALLMKDRGRGAFDIKRKLTELAEVLLPSRMGSRYARIVVSCLTCLDPDETNQFGNKDDLVDDDGVIVGIQYIEKILTQIEDLSI